MTQQQQDKQAFYALHLGSELIVPDEPKETWYPFDKGESGLKLTGVVGYRIVVHRIAEELYDTFHQTKLHLNSLSNISDEDAIEVGNYINGLGVYTVGLKAPLEMGKAHIDGRTYHKNLTHLSQWVIDYLRSRGYLLPFRGMSCEELIEKGWVKIKE